MIYYVIFYDGFTQLAVSLLIYYLSLNFNIFNKRFAKDLKEQSLLSTGWLESRRLQYEKLHSTVILFDNLFSWLIGFNLLFIMPFICFNIYLVASQIQNRNANSYTFLILKFLSVNVLSFSCGVLHTVVRILTLNIYTIILRYASTLHTINRQMSFGM